MLPAYREKNSQKQKQNTKKSKAKQIVLFRSKRIVTSHLTILLLLRSKTKFFLFFERPSATVRLAFLRRLLFYPLLRQRDVPEEKYSNAFLGFGPETSYFVVELTCNYGVSSYDIGTGFGHFSISTPDVTKLVETVRAHGGNVTREPGPVKGGSSVIAFVKDPSFVTGTLQLLRVSLVFF